jgi:ubiquitin-protein ligase
MAGTPLSEEKILDKFCFDLDELIAIGFLASSVAGGNGEAKILFNNSIVSNCAFDDRFLPDPIKYINNMGLEMNEEKIRDFIRVSKTEVFMRHFHRCLVVESMSDQEYTDDFIDNEISTDPLSFFILLYFFLFSLRVTLIPMTITEKVRSWRVENDIDKLRSFGEIDSPKRLLFHGTPANCVYSILRNGLKGLSGSKYMTTGAVYGKGIYCSDNISLAGTYAKSIYTPEGGQSCSYLLVLMVKNANEKAPGYFVQKDDEVFICGIIECSIGHFYIDTLLHSTIQQHGNILFRNTDISSFEKKSDSKKVVSLSETLRTTIIDADSPQLLHFNMHDSPQNMSKVVSSKRFREETRCIMQKVCQDGKKEVPWGEDILQLITRANFNEPDNMCSPFLVEFVPPADTPLYEDLQRNKIPGIILAFHFVDHYPFDPFEVRVVYPRFREHTGRVTAGGSICMSNLYPVGGWSPSTNMFGIIISIISVLPNEGQSGDENASKGRLAENCKRTYSYSEYQTGYRTAKTFHGW